ncbi:MAG: Zn-dependent protease [bacterium]|nr:Zn-dependent protease [bacterium]
MKKSYLLFLLLVYCFSLAWADQSVSIAVVPLDYDQLKMVDFVVSAINSCYHVQVTVLPKQKLPPGSFYRPRQRYRADKILDHLATSIDGKYQKVLGITGRDISTTKGDIYDWGIFGLGSLGGRACVVSTFRLKGKASPTLLKQRIAKVVNHELGHTLGLDHCPTFGCLMEDAGGTIKTVDRESGSFCGQCRIKLGGLVK